jgi:hypothetical protein
MTMIRRLKGIAKMALMLSFLGDDCTPVALEDGSFNRWKSDSQLVAWDTTAGTIHKAPTWDDADPGVEFVETPTEISQAVQGSAACIQVTVMGFVDEDAQLEVKTSTSFQVPALNWNKYTDYLSLTESKTTTSTTTTPLLRIRKNGPGKVILSSVEAKSASGCGPSTQQ